MIDRSRGSPALHKFFTETFEGVLITDFRQAYWSVDVRDRRFCLPHLLRDMVGVDQHSQSACRPAFSKKLRRLLRDGMRLAARRREFEPEDYRRHCTQLDTRLMAIATADYIDADAKRLGKRMLRHCDHIFTFLDYEYVASDNNFGERQIRPAVIIRKNSQSNRSEKGAATQSILMSVYRTLRLRGHDPIATMVEALRTFVETGKLPPLPDPISTQE